VRHQALTGLGSEDINILKQLRDRELSSETTQQMRDSWLSKRTPSSEQHATRSLGAASMAVNLAEGNSTGAALDAASMLAESETVQKAATRAAIKTGLTEGFELAAKRIPVIGAGVTIGFVLYSSGAQAMAGNYDLAAAELAAGTAEAAGNIVGFGAGDLAREAARQGLIATGGDRFAEVEKSGLRQLGEGAYGLAVSTYEEISPPKGQGLGAVLPPSHASMAQGADMMGERSEVSRIAIERTGLAANDPTNNMTTLAQEVGRPRAHLLILEDGSVQGPESGGVGFGNNPQIAAGRNGGTLGILYAGTGAMNDAQWKTVQQVQDWLGTQRGTEGLSSNIETIAGSTKTAELLNLPTPRGARPTAGTAEPTLQQTKPQRLVANGLNN